MSQNGDTARARRRSAAQPQAFPGKGTVRSRSAPARLPSPLSPSPGQGSDAIHTVLTLHRCLLSSNTSCLGSTSTSCLPAEPGTSVPRESPPPSAPLPKPRHHVVRRPSSSSTSSTTRLPTPIQPYRTPSPGIPLPDTHPLLPLGHFPHVLVPLAHPQLTLHHHIPPCSPRFTPLAPPHDPVRGHAGAPGVITEGRKHGTSHRLTPPLQPSPLPTPLEPHWPHVNSRWQLPHPRSPSLPPHLPPTLPTFRNCISTSATPVPLGHPYHPSPPLPAPLPHCHPLTGPPLSFPSLSGTSRAHSTRTLSTSTPLAPNFCRHCPPCSHCHQRRGFLPLDALSDLTFP